MYQQKIYMINHSKMEELKRTDDLGRIIDWVIPEVDDDRYYYRVVIDRNNVYYASSEQEAYCVLGELVEAREQGKLEEKIKEVNNR